MEGEISMQKIAEIIDKLDCGFVDEWQIRNAEDVHPSHRTKVFDITALEEAIRIAYQEGLNKTNKRD